jgi:peptidoglycan/LPS O-acetylase OafA/YrhL
VFAVKPTSNHSYRPEIDGLRAVAVLAVVLFHAKLALPGGFIGVDVFFVISGFLITSIILRDLESGSFRLSRFWERRCRRLLPAYFACATGVLIAGWWLLLPADLVEFSKTLLAQTVSASNIYFWRSLHYFHDVSEEQPFLHMWSLSVEEQFYLVLSLIILGCTWLKPSTQKAALVVVTLVTFAVSFVLGAYAAFERPNTAFFLLPTRAWEMACGAVLAVAPRWFVVKNRSLREAISALGLIAIVVPTFLYSDLTPFPGLAAAPPCFGTLAVIAVNSPLAGSDPALTAVGRLLSVGVLKFVGAISYSLYLWHWPVMALSSYLTCGDISLKWQWGNVAASLFLGTLSWWLVEQPFRERRLCATPRAMFVFSGLGLCTAAILGAAIVRTDGAPERFPQMSELKSQLVPAMFNHEQVTLEDVVAGRLQVIGVKGPDAPVAALLWGDSHAADSARGFDAFFEKRGQKAVVATYAATAPLVEGFRRSPFGLNERTSDYAREVVKHVKANRIRQVFLIGEWETYATTLQEADLFAAIQKTRDELIAAGADVWFVLCNPVYPVSVPDAFARSTVLGISVPKLRLTYADHRRNNVVADRAARELFSDRTVDFSLGFTDVDRVEMEILRDGQMLYMDRAHVTLFAGKTILGPELERQLGPRWDNAQAGLPNPRVESGQ